jgi:hypothetical protein
MLEELLGQEGVRGDLAHHDQLEVVLAALDDSLRAQHDVIASVWPEATADQATAVVDSLRRLRVFGFAERVSSGHGPMRWRRTKAVR